MPAGVAYFCFQSHSCRDNPARRGGLLEQRQALIDPEYTLKGEKGPCAGKKKVENTEME